MGDAFRRLFLGLGVALGLASGQPDPSIFASLSAVGDSLVLYARVEHAFAPGALELIEAGTRVALRYSARVEGMDGRVVEASETRALWYDMRSGLYGVSFDGDKKAELVDPQAARTLVSELRGLAICRVAEAAEGRRAVISAEIGIVDGRGGWHDAPVLWNYYGPRAVLVVDAVADATKTGPQGEPMMRTRTRFALLFACIGAAVTATGVAAIYGAVGRAAAGSLPARAEALLGEASKRAIDDTREEGARLEEATESLIEARSLLAENRIMARDAVVALAIKIASILAVVMGAATLAFFLLSRLITKGLDDLASGAILAQEDRSRRFPRYSDPDLDAAGSALNDLLDLATEQEKRLAEASRLEGWREVASFLAHQLKNPLAALRIAAQNGSLSLGSSESKTLALESFDIVLAEAKRLAALIDRFRDLAPSSLEPYTASGKADLAELLACCAARAEIAGARVTIAMAGDRAGPNVAGDRALLEQAFWNLFANSIEAGGESGGVVIRVVVELPSGEGEAITLLTDSNRGLDPALLPRLGRERVTTKAEGTGLGLILVRRILAAQGGELELFADASGGLGARVRLPLAKEPA